MNILRDIPDLDFTIWCPVCGNSVSRDGVDFTSFTCNSCQITWNAVGTHGKHK